LQETYKEHDLNTEIFPKDIVTCINNEEKIIRNIMETSEVEIAREMYYKDIIVYNNINLYYYIYNIIKLYYINIILY
jgi:hypothetical protein